MNSLIDNDITKSQRPYVLELQTYLRALEREATGTTIVPRDGYFGKDTATGVANFQSANGLLTTGVVDRETWEAIVLAYEVTQLAAAPPLSIPGLQRPSLTVGDRGDSVAFLMIMLDALAAQHSNIAAQPDKSLYTEKTAEAIRAIQSAAQLPETGITDKATWDAVVLLYSTLAQGGNR